MHASNPIPVSMVGSRYGTAGGIRINPSAIILDLKWPPKTRKLALCYAVRIFKYSLNVMHRLFHEKHYSTTNTSYVDIIYFHASR